MPVFDLDTFHIPNFSGLNGLVYLFLLWITRAGTPPTTGRSGKLRATSSPTMACEPTVTPDIICTQHPIQASLPNTFSAQRCFAHSSVYQVFDGDASPYARENHRQHSVAPNDVFHAFEVASIPPLTYAPPDEYMFRITNRYVGRRSTERADPPQFLHVSLKSFVSLGLRKPILNIRKKSHDIPPRNTMDSIHSGT